MKLKYYILLNDFKKINKFIYIFSYLKTFISYFTLLDTCKPRMCISLQLYNMMNFNLRFFLVPLNQWSQPLLIDAVLVGFQKSLTLSYKSKQCIIIVVFSINKPHIIRNNLFLLMIKIIKYK